jgi:hypothetical protein
MRRLLAPLAVLLLAPGVGGASERRLTAEPTAGEVAAYGGKVVWSRGVDVGFDLEYQLVETTAAGPRDLPVARSREPFQLDLGPGIDGAPVAVYVRCIEASHCDVHRYDFARRRESRVEGISGPRCSATEPSIWRGRIAFIRQNFFTAGCVSGLYVREPTGKVRRLLREPPDFKAAVYQPKLRGGWVAYAASGDHSATSEIHVMRIRGRHSRRVTKATGEIALYPLPGPAPPDRPLGSGFSVSAPRLLGRFVYWVRWDIPHNKKKIGRALRLRPARKQYRPLPPGATLSGDHVYVEDGHGLVELPLPRFSRR